jgi:hypothetical protein
MGASWICIIVMLWYWLFKPMSSFILISKDADAVDANSHLSLLWKWDFILKHLSDWLRPSVMKTSMFWENLDNGATITGQSSTGKAGVGGRCDGQRHGETGQANAQHNRSAAVSKQRYDHRPCRSTHLIDA